MYLVASFVTQSNKTIYYHMQCLHSVEYSDHNVERREYLDKLIADMVR